MDSRAGRRAIQNRQRHALLFTPSWQQFETLEYSLSIRVQAVECRSTQIRGRQCREAGDTGTPVPPPLVWPGRRRRWRPLTLMPTLTLRNAHPDHQENDDHFLVEEASPCGEEEEGNGTQGESRSPSSPTPSLSLFKQSVVRLVCHLAASLTSTPGSSRRGDSRKNVVEMEK